MMVRIPRHAPGIPEVVLQKLVLARLNDIPGVRVWRANVGVARDGKTGRVIRFGVPGQADLTGTLAPNGRRLEVELKTEKGRQSPEQRTWQLETERYGGIYILARTLEEAIAPVCEALGLSYEVS